MAAACACLCACSGGGETVAPSTSGKSDPFDFQGNTVKPEVVIDGVDDDALWSSDGVAHISFSSCEVSVLRRSNAIYAYFKVFDVTPYRYISEGAADEVTYSDSIELYIDSKLSRTEKPYANCYQINLGRDSRTRIMSSNGGLWYEWAGMYTFEAREGYNAEYDYYFLEMMVPVAQLGIGGTEDVGIAFGHVDRTVDDNRNLESYYKWYGVNYDGEFVDPQIPSTYLVLRASDGKIMSYDRYYTEKNTTQTPSEGE